MECPKCSYTRKPTDTAPDWECPQCGIVYAKYEAKLASEAEEKARRQRPSPDERQKIVLIACATCEHRISVRALACPKCKSPPTAPAPPPQVKSGRLALLLIFGVPVGVAVGLCVNSLLGPGGAGSSSVSAQNFRTSSAATTVTIRRTEYGSQWPFVVDSGVLACKSGIAAVFITGTATYALNGPAMSMGYSSIDAILLPNPEIPGLKISVGPIVSRGVALCSRS
jgi:hypothetical protein